SVWSSSCFSTTSGDGGLGLSMGAIQFPSIPLDGTVMRLAEGAGNAPDSGKRTRDLNPAPPLGGPTLQTGGADVVLPHDGRCNIGPLRPSRSRAPTMDTRTTISLRVCGDSLHLRTLGAVRAGLRTRELVVQAQRVLEEVEPVAEVGLVPLLLVGEHV